MPLVLPGSVRSSSQSAIIDGAKRRGDNERTSTFHPGALGAPGARPSSKNEEEYQEGSSNQSNKNWEIFISGYLHCDWPGVGGRGRTLSGGHRLVTITVAGSGIDVPPLMPAFEYGTGSCLQIKVEMRKYGLIMQLLDYWLPESTGSWGQRPCGGVTNEVFT